MDMPSDYDRQMIFEHARKVSEAAYIKDPRDVDNLTMWGSALLELSSLQAPSEAKNLLQEAVSKLEEALEINAKKPETLWCLGNAMTALAFSFPDAEEAGSYFKKATDYFAKASEADPSNGLFRKSLEVSSKAPALHAEFHSHKAAFGQQVANTTAGPSSSSATRTTTKKNKSSDLTYDIMGWVILAFGLVAWVGFSKDHMQVPPPQPR